MFSKLKAKMFEGLATWCINRALRTPHEHLLHDDGKPLLHRYWLFRIGSKHPNGDGEIHPWFAVRVVQLVSNEEPIFHDEACHSLTVVLRGGICEIVPRELDRWRDHIEVVNRYHGLDPVAYDTDHGHLYAAGAVFRRKAWDYHFFTLPNGNDAWLLQIAGPKRQLWGYLIDGLHKVPWPEFQERRRQRRAQNNGRKR
jgi:hypothetical protein